MADPTPEGDPSGGGQPFSVVTEVVPDGAGRFKADVDPGWTVGGKPNGGYLLTTMARAATWEAAHDHVVAASAHYLWPPDPGPVTVEAEVLRAGRSASQVRARLTQDGRPCVEALMTAAHLDPATVPHWDAGLPARRDGRPDDSPRLHPHLPDGSPVAILNHVDFRLDPDTAGFADRRPAGRGELWGWLGLPDGEPFDPLSLLYAVDSFPPATFDIEPSGWVPTLELTVYVRAVPAPGPVQVLQRAHLIDAGRVDEACFVWDGTGRLVAQGTQLAGIRIG